MVARIMLSKFFLPFILFITDLLPTPTPYFPDAPTTPVFIVITIPKSGTHLLTKCLNLLQTRTQSSPINFFKLNHNDYTREIPGLLTKLRQAALNPNKYMVMHAHLSAPIERFLELYPEVPLLLNVRDLHDALISLSYHFGSHIDRILGKSPATPHERLNFLLTYKDSKCSQQIPDLRHHAEKIFALFNHPNALLVRFDELVGAKGGGNDAIQAATIRKIAAHIGAPLTDKRLKEIQATLFGNKGLRSNTFRSGQEGAWRKLYTSEQIHLFNNLYGEAQLDIGYSLE